MGDTTVSASCYSYTLYFGRFIQLPREPDSLATPESSPVFKLSVKHGALWVDECDGRIAGFNWDIGNEDELDELAKSMNWNMDDGKDGEKHTDNSTKKRVKLIRSSEAKNGFFFPGFIDAHIHAPQYPNAGLFGSSTLLDWLKKYTYPMEESFGNKEDPEKPSDTAHVAYNRVVSRTLSHGTTCAAYYATVHVPATNLLASICYKRGQRAFVGRMCMDNKETCPETYRDESPAEMVAATKASMEYIKSIDPSSTLVQPIITPRFSIACTETALSALGDLAASTSPPSFIQTHVSENKDEVQMVANMFQHCENYAEVYDRTKLLTPRTVLGHAVHLTSQERALIRSRSTSIAHCPPSNSALGSGLCPVRTLLDEGITVGLGTDVSGGYSPSILETARQAALVSRMVASLSEKKHPSREKISVEEALYLATRGGAKAFQMEDQIGGFEKGMYWDAQMIELGKEVGQQECTDDTPLNEELSRINGGVGNNVDIFGWEDWDERVAKWMWNGDDRNIKAVWVGGRLVHGRE